MKATWHFTPVKVALLYGLGLLLGLELGAEVLSGGTVVRWQTFASIANLGLFSLVGFFTSRKKTPDQPSEQGGALKAS